MKVDIHAHYFPQELVKLLAKGEDDFQARLLEKDGQTWVCHEQGYTYPLPVGFYDLESRLPEMAKAGIEQAVLSVAPPLFYYWAEAEFAAKVARLVNEAIGEQVTAYPEKFRGMGTVPMQSPERAVQELHYCVEKLGFKAVEIGANVEGVQYDDPLFLPFFKACAELDVVVTLHPYYVGAKGMFSKYYLTNLLGNPLDSTVAAASLIFGGVLEQCPGLKVCLAHGGGFLPYQFGRLGKGYQVRTEPKVKRSKEPGSYLRQFYFDTILFSAQALHFLVEFAGAGHVLMGTDYPFDMGETVPVDFVTQSGISPSDQVLVLGENARKLFW